MREIGTEAIADAVRGLCITANRRLPASVEREMREACACEQCLLAREVLGDLVRNFEEAERLGLPVCQDTGMAVVFADVGQDVHITGGVFADAVDEGVRRGYLEGLLRCSVVADPIRRGNTGDNTPAILHTRIVPGDRLMLTVAPKGFGSENMSALRMLTPSATEDDVVAFVVETVSRAGSNPCPPVVVGVGVGGDFERCAELAKRALCRDLDEPNPDPYYAALEERTLEAVNRLGIGPQGFGGTVTALAVRFEAGPTHIAGLPVAVNMGCHVTRHASVTL